MNKPVFEGVLQLANTTIQFNFKPKPGRMLLGGLLLGALLYHFFRGGEEGKVPEVRKKVVKGEVIERARERVKTAISERVIHKESDTPFRMRSGTRVTLASARGRGAIEEISVVADSPNYTITINRDGHSIRRSWEEYNSLSPFDRKIDANSYENYYAVSISGITFNEEFNATLEADSDLTVERYKVIGVVSPR